MTSLIIGNKFALKPKNADTVSDWLINWVLFPVISYSVLIKPPNKAVESKLWRYYRNFKAIVNDG